MFSRAKILLPRPKGSYKVEGKKCFSLKLQFLYNSRIEGENKKLYNIMRNEISKTSNGGIKMADSQQTLKP
jgi:hypothetical protein